MSEASRRPPRGFTLIELMVVLVILGILMSFILVAAMDGIRRAEERSTQSLMIKLDTGISDRIEALLSMSVVPTTAHSTMARIVVSSTPLRTVEGNQRAHVIAMYDMMRAEFPDVFFVVPPGTGGAYAPDSYPLNFAAQPLGTTGTHLDYILPLGAPSSQESTGIYGASYSAAAGIYKNLGYLPTGYDNIDNSLPGHPADGFIDEFGEGVDDTNRELVMQRLAAHQHKTARSEMLYAILVEGQGPLGSVFNADEFTDREVRDTDGDGLPEFVDAWGQPLQFYRWPIMYHSDLQKGHTGVGPYNGVIEPREQDPLDPNQQLVAPAWWSSTSNVVSGGSAPLSGGAVAFQNHFHSLIEPLSRGTTATSPNFWDRGNPYRQRRAYYSKFLIASSGPDQELGIAQLTPSLLVPGPGNDPVANLRIENQAAQATYQRTAAPYFAPDPALQSETTRLQEVGLDDITNHSLLAAGGGVQ